jgi:hypothetical protein
LGVILEVADAFGIPGDHALNPDPLVLILFVEVVNHTFARLALRVPAFPSLNIELVKIVQSDAVHVIWVEFVDLVFADVELGCSLLAHLSLPIDGVAQQKEELMGKNVVRLQRHLLHVPQVLVFLLQLSLDNPNFTLKCLALIDGVVKLGRD